MSHETARRLITAAAMIVTGCADRSPEPRAHAETSCTAREVQEVVERFGERGDQFAAFPACVGAWGNDGAASGQTYEEFAAGFATTERVAVEIGAPGRVEPAAGSRYVEVPVILRAVMSAGDTQRFEGSYTLRRGVVDGASPRARRWHIHSADISRVR